MTRYSYNPAGMETYYYNNDINMILYRIRQKNFAGGVERAMIAAQRLKPKTIKEQAERIVASNKEASAKALAKKIRKINRRLNQSNEDSGVIKPLDKFLKAISGKETRQRLKMGYNSQEAVDKLRKMKISQAIKESEKLDAKKLDKKLVERALRKDRRTKTLAGTAVRAKEVVKNVGKNAKDSVEKAYQGAKKGISTFVNDTSSVAGKTGEILRKNGDVAIVSGGSALAGFALPPAMNAVYQSVTNVARPSLAYIGLKDVSGLSNRPVKHKIRDAEGKVTGIKIMPAKKHKAIQARHLRKKIEGSGWSIKSGLDKIRENYRASHPQPVFIPQ